MSFIINDHWESHDLTLLSFNFSIYVTKQLFLTMKSLPKFLQR